MIPFIKKLLGLHIHEWGQWTVAKVFVRPNTGTIKTVQSRQCKTCGKTEILSTSND